MERENNHIEEICKCGHHTKDHSYNPDWSTNLSCDICDCKEFNTKRENGKRKHRN